MQRTTLAAAAWILIASLVPAYAACPSPAGFNRWLQQFKQEAAAQGISKRTISAALNGVRYDPAVIRKDRAQGVFAQNFLQFSGRMVGGYRQKQGAAQLRKYAPVFARIKKQYGVPGPVLVAFWGLETDFGKVMGKMQTMQSLATLSFDCRRPEEFRAQLLDALRVIERGDLSPAQMRGPAHGEVGQFQFQPTNYYKYAVDFDGNGRRDLIRSAPDSLASAANYLRSIGWQPGQPWLEEVIVPADLPWDQADVTIKKPRAFWAKHGVTYRNGKAVPADNLPASLVLPMGRKGPAFLAYPNFDIYLEWNQSLVYTTTAAYFATRLGGAPPLKRGRAQAMSAAQTKEVQRRLAKLGHDVGKIDGVIGAATRRAIRTMQIQYGLPADGYPSQALLTRLRGGR
jgi:lytic murein transglycosylase